ncbi:MAG: peptidoglycan bridge formation glycyltransferase FemA/FemB family protein [Chloroflexi bacterium]|nr:peptidoglycan bridge formation glycyltransferase FemA/FemB family protein [Chloroflexota bacterium]
MTTGPAASHLAEAPGLRRIERAAEWDDFVASSPEGHLLQSSRWGDLKARYGWTVERLMAAAGGGVAGAQVFWRRTPLGPLAYVPRGPVVQPAGHLEAGRALLEALHRLARSRRAPFLKVEPNSGDPAPWPALGLRPSLHTFQPRATLLLDLTEDLETLRMRQLAKTRYNTGLAARKGVQVRRGSVADIPAFFKLVEETGHRNVFAVRSMAYYRDMLEVMGDQAELLLATHEGDLLAGIIAVRFGPEAIYLYGGSAGLKRNLMPTYLLQWEAIRRAREQGMARYDLWGVPPEVAEEAEALAEERPFRLPVARDHQDGDLWGVYRFKRGFGGQIQLYCGAYDYVYSPIAHGLWERVLPHVRGWLRRSQVSGD